MSNNSYPGDPGPQGYPPADGGQPGPPTGPPNPSGSGSQPGQPGPGQPNYAGSGPGNQGYPPSGTPQPQPGYGYPAADPGYPQPGYGGGYGGPPPAPALAPAPAPKRNMTPFLILGIVILLALGGVTVWLLLDRKQPETTKPNEQTTQVSTPAPSTDPAPPPTTDPAPPPTTDPAPPPTTDPAPPPTTDPAPPPTTDPAPPPTTDPAPPPTTDPAPPPTTDPATPQPPNPNGSLPALMPAEVAGLKALGDPGKSMTIYMSAANSQLASVFHIPFLSGNELDTSDLKDPKKIGVWTCGTTELGSAACITEAYKGSLTVAGPGDTAESVAKWGDAFLAAWK